MHIKRPWQRQSNKGATVLSFGRLCRLVMIAGLIAGLLSVFLQPAKEPTTAPSSAALSTVVPASLVRKTDSGLNGIGLGRLARLINLVDDPEEACLAAGARSQRTHDKTELSRLVATLAQSPLGSALLARSRAEGTFICLDRRTDLMGYYRSGLRLIGINDRLTPAERIVFLAHELAHVPQHATYSDNRFYPVNDLILLRRVREATAEALSTLILWQLRQGGEEAAWNSKIADRFYGDIARAFAKAWHEAPAGEQRHAATRAAFDRWFAVAARRRLYDRMTVDHLQRISKDSLGLVSPRKRLRDSFLRGIAWVGGWNFLIASQGPALTDLTYSGGVSLHHAATLERLLDGREHQPARQPIIRRSNDRADAARGRAARRTHPGA